MHIWILYAVGRDIGHNGQEGVGSELEMTDGKAGVPGGRPVLPLLVLEIDETSSDEAVDPCSRVGLGIDDKAVGQAGRRRYKDIDHHDPVEEEGSGGGIKGFHGGSETAEKGKALLVKTAVYKTDCKCIPKKTEGDEDGESACTSTITEDIAEEETGNNDLRVGEIFGDCGEVSDIGKNIPDHHTTCGMGAATLGVLRRFLSSPRM